MKKINYLKKGDTIDLIAPSFGCTTEPYKTLLKHSIKNLKKAGFKVNQGENVWLNKGHVRSNSAKKCAEEFNKAYASKSKAIISVGGGETMCEILPYVDFEAVKNLPHKFFMGFSDNTNLTYTLTTIADVPTIYGPCAPSFAFLFDKERRPVQDALKVLTNKTKELSGYPKWQKDSDHEERVKHPLLKPNYKAKKVLTIYSKNKKFNVNGRLIGGCLDCLITLCGTKFDHTKEFLEKYKKDGFIWFIEACDLSPIGIERALFQLKNAGWFKYVKGFVFGRPLCYDQKYFDTVDRFSSVKEALKGINAPILFDADLGHFDPTLPIVCGVNCNVFVKKKNVFFKYNKKII